MNKLIKYVISIPWVPVSLNKLIGSRGRSFRKSNEVKKWAQYLILIKNAKKIETIKHCEIEIKVFISTRSGRLPDADNLIKIPLDALVAAGIIEDDNPKVIKNCNMSVCRTRGQGETIINIYQ